MEGPEFDDEMPHKSKYRNSADNPELMAIVCVLLNRSPFPFLGYVQRSIMRQR